MSFIDSRNDLVKRIRHWVTRKTIEQRGHETEWRDKEKGGGQPPSGMLDLEKLTLERYLSPKTEPGHHRYIAMYGSDVWEHEYEKTEWIEYPFLDFGQNSISALESLQNDLLTLVGNLCADSTWRFTEASPLRSDLEGYWDRPNSELGLSNAMSLLDSWTGDAAAVVHTTLGADGDHWESIVASKYIIAAVLLYTVNAQLSVMVCARRDILEIGEVAIEVLWGIDQPSSVDGKLFITVLASVATVGLTVASFGVSAAVVGAIASVATNAMAAAESPKGKVDDSGLVEQVEKQVKEEEKKQEKMEEKEPKDDDESEIEGSAEIDGVTPTDVMDGLYQTIMHLKEQTSTAEKNIAKNIKTIYDNAVEHYDSFNINFEKGLWTIDETKNVDDESLFGEPTQYINPIKMVEAAEDFKNTLDPLYAAYEILVNTVDLEFEAFHSDHKESSSSALYEWSCIRDFLQDCIVGNMEKLNDTAIALVECTKDFVDADAENAEKLDELREAVGEMEMEYSGAEHNPNPDHTPSNSYKEPPKPGEYQ